MKRKRIEIHRDLPHDAEGAGGLILREHGLAEEA